MSRSGPIPPIWIVMTASAGLGGGSAGTVGVLGFGGAMDNDALDKLTTHIAAMERVIVMLLSDALKRLPPEEAYVLESVLTPKPQLLKVANINTDDRCAGRTSEYENFLARMLAAAHEIAFPAQARTQTE